MRSDELAATLTEIQRRWMYNIIYPNVDHTGRRRRDDTPWNALIVLGDLGPAEGHEHLVYEDEEGCVGEGHSNYQFVAWIDVHGAIHYVSPGVR